MCQNKNIVQHVKRLLIENEDDFINISDNYFCSKKYDETVEINISYNYFTIYSTSWGCTTRRKITFFKIDDNEILSFDNNEVTKDGKIIQNYKYEFRNSDLVSFSYSKKVDLEYELGKELKKIKKDLVIDIFPIDNNEAIKMVKQNGTTNYYYTEINPIKLSDIHIFSSLYSKMDSKVNFEGLKKILK